MITRKISNELLRVIQDITFRLFILKMRIHARINWLRGKEMAIIGKDWKITKSKYHDWKIYDKKVGCKNWLRSIKFTDAE